MSLNIPSDEIERLVQQVVERVRNDVSLKPETPQKTPDTGSAIQSSATAPNFSAAEGIFDSIDAAVQAANKAYEEYSAVSLYRRKRFLEAMRTAAREHAEVFAREAVAETGLGKVEDKIQKNLLAANKTPGVEDLAPLAYTGDDGLTLVEPAPFGVIGAVTPSTNPAATVINNSISIVAAGNAVVFNPHPSAKAVTNHAVAVINESIRKAGGPSTLLCSTAQPTLKSSQALMEHAGIRLLLVTGGGLVVSMAMKSGKRCIAAGPGNPPVIVDDTATITKAARAIVDGASFDNNILCTAEKEIFAFDSIADQLMSEMVGYGAYRATGDEINKLVDALVEPGQPHPHPKRQYVGKDASTLLQAAGITPSREVKLVICETDFDHPLVHAEMLMPIVPVVRVKDLQEALEKAKLAEHGNRHSAYMHSESVSNMSLVARRIETTIFVKNAPSYAGLGFGGEGYCTLSIAGPTGEGLTSARSFTRQRRCVLAGAFRII